MSMRQWQEVQALPWQECLIYSDVLLASLLERNRYINVILPLKLGWEPFYLLSEGVQAKVGDRALVPFAGRSYLAVVSEVGVAPDSSVRNVREIYGLQEYKDKILPSEIAFWRSLAQYYMCSVGEVYKAAYPSVKDESVRVRKKETAFVAPCAALEGLGSGAAELSSQLRAYLGGTKPVLLSADDSEAVLLDAALYIINKGKNVLWLVPEIKLGKALEERVRSAVGSALIVWGSNITPAKKREAARVVRSGAPYVVLGTRSSLFLPHHDLGLAIVQEEHEMSYKQSSPAPRYNGRDAAVMLALHHKAAVVLESRTPSFESMLNAMTGKYHRVSSLTPENVQWDIVDTRAELFKNGMKGELSVKLMQAVAECQADCDSCQGDGFAFYKPRRAAFPKMEQLLPELRAAFGDNVFVTDDLVTKPIPEGVRMLGIFGTDALLSRQDFRADERYIQMVGQAMEQCGSSLKRIVIQTKSGSHPVLEAIASHNTDSYLRSLMTERREFSYPPFSRIVDIVFHDEYADRMSRKMSELMMRINSVFGSSIVAPMLVPGYGLRVILYRDVHLTSRKLTLQSIVEDFERTAKYASHMHFDVDPQ